MKLLYKKIIEKLTSEDAKTFFTSKGVKAPKHIDEFEGQYYDQANVEGFTAPSVFFEYDIDYTGKTPVATVNLHLCYEQPRHANSRSKNIDRDLKRYDFNLLVHQLVNKLESETTGKLQLIAESPLKEAAIVKVDILTYQCSYVGKEESILEEYKWYEETDPVIEGNIVAYDDYEVLDTQRSILVTSPNGGEIYEPGEKMNITWDSFNIPEPVEISLYSNAVKVDTISLLASGHIYTWSIPINISLGSLYTIEVKSIDHPAILDTSDSNFTITTKKR